MIETKTTPKQEFLLWFNKIALDKAQQTGMSTPENKTDNPKVYEALRSKLTRQAQIVAHESNRLKFQPNFIKINVVNQT